ncbi:hypothetical protein N7539_003394 [Penicillium diatomitis]|uniref:Calcium channel YVC1-like C-terminal transmembrane domain-containing protein n=1 Tax=Penicillium diatomitis TaxID=2819901 RepID=A0A9X0BXI0_9EURO|nr:uncharacterized protein N7539_003394 [Penicillium diatomitis]KAJ5488504.1 hypothetical protein N7539_003394 [Penicillium diatomitis]
MCDHHRDSFASDAASGAEPGMDLFDIPLVETDDPLFIVISKLSQILKWDYSTTAQDDWGLNESRGVACEFVAWQFLCHLNQRETIEVLLEELPSSRRESTTSFEPETGSNYSATRESHESTPLLEGQHLSGHQSDCWQGKQASHCQHRNNHRGSQFDTVGDGDMMRISRFFGLNALEIAAIAGAKKFLSQRVVQRVVNGIWNGDIIFWDSLTVHSLKKPQRFNRKYFTQTLSDRTADPYSRLRVPVYRKMFEAAFFLSFLFLYYCVLVERKTNGLGLFETLMDIWILAFAYDELSGFIDAGIMFYQTDFWSLWNLGIIGVGFAFIGTRAVGLLQNNDFILDLSFDILSLEALFLVPRFVVPGPRYDPQFVSNLTSSLQDLLSREPKFILRKPSTLISSLTIPVLKEMADNPWRELQTKAFLRFLPVVIVLYIGFLTTFTMLARDRLSLKQMSWMLVKVFFGSPEISPIFGYGLMMVFVAMTNILLLSSLISLMSMSMEGVMRHAREEYLFQSTPFLPPFFCGGSVLILLLGRLSIYVLESSNSRRLTYFMPPLNLIPLLCIRPMRLFLSAGTVRRVRIMLLRATHLPFVALISAYEHSQRHLRRSTATSLPPPSTAKPPRTFGGDRGVSRWQDPPLSSSRSTRRADLAKRRLSVPHDISCESSMARPDEAHLVELLNTVDRLQVQVERLTTEPPR